MGGSYWPSSAAVGAGIVARPAGYVRWPYWPGGMVVYLMQSREAKRMETFESEEVDSLVGNRSQGKARLVEVQGRKRVARKV